MKIALVYDRVNKWGGAERVLLALNEMFPKAPLYTSVYNSKTAPWADVFPKVIPSFLQRLPFAKNNHEFLAPLMPLAFESFNFSEYDLVISVTSEAAKGIITIPTTKHICICLTPTRYLWSGYDDYFKGQIVKWLARPLVRYLKYWDKMAAQRPDVLIAISSEVRERIKKYYDLDSSLIFPPVDLSHFNKKKTSRRFSPDSKDYYLVVSRLVGYKRVDLAIKAFNKRADRLVIIGKGKEENMLKNMAQPNITFVSELTDKELIAYYDGAKALIMPQYEDFGLVAVEAQIRGVPVIAFSKGGAKDTVIHGKTGILFSRQTVASILKALDRFESSRLDRKVIMKNAQRFSKAIFRSELLRLIKQNV